MRFLDVSAAESVSSSSDSAKSVITDASKGGMLGRGSIREDRILAMS
jgi:hypothetical protein